MLRFDPACCCLKCARISALFSARPMMSWQCLAQALMPIGIACVLGRDSIARAIAFFVIFAVGVLSGMFTIASGTVEECDDLLTMSPRRTLLFRFGKMLSGCLFPLSVAFVIGLGLLLSGEYLLAGAVLLGGIPLGITTSIVGETFANPVKPGVKPKLLADPIDDDSTRSACRLLAASWLMVLLVFALDLLAAHCCVIGLLGSYVVFVLSIGLAQLRKPLF